MLKKKLKNSAETKFAFLVAVTMRGRADLPFSYFDISELNTLCIG